MQRKDLLKRKSIRYAEYYNMVEIQDKLYADSKDGKTFKNLIEIISSENNIKMAYRNLKTNSGSNTAGVDGLTFEDIDRLSEAELVGKVKDKIQNYQPKAVRRVYIPKANGKLRPLGIPTVIDRIVQQSVLQVMEPICEAKFYDKSYGFRPNRSTKHAVAMCYKLAQHDGFHYVVDIDIKGFFDNVDHAKLLKQIWTLGIQDKNLLCLISKMLKAPIEEKGKRTVPEKGTPQGGVLSPLLANIVLNELDWWVASQWEEMPMRNPCPSDEIPNKNGSLNRGAKYTRLRKTRLKECHLVRYADDFKIFCKTYGDAIRFKHATEQWLSERLGLEISEEKTKVCNLKKNYSEFLGIKFKLRQKGKRWVVKSHMTDKAIKTQRKVLAEAMTAVCKAHNLKIAQHNDVIAYNQKVVGVHEYYNMATMICSDMHKLFPPIYRKLRHASSTNAIRKTPPPYLMGAMDEYFFQKYKDSAAVRYINGMIIVPVGYCRTKPPMCHSPGVNRYTPEGREAIHRMLSDEAYGEVLNELSKATFEGMSIKQYDNMLSRFVAAKGRCEITKLPLELEDVYCHKLHPMDEDADRYSNLRIVHKDVEKLIYEEDLNEIKTLVERLDVKQSAKLVKLNKWREFIGKEPVNLPTLNRL
ncbi:MAG: group II intron reverse transcriptase/maturase [Mogibacterium sp.]|nr:group II intron reverse transcriptase/maturase [Mogibacterium sp.]